MSSQIWTPFGDQIRALGISIDQICMGGERGGGKTDTGIVKMMIPAVGELANPRYRGLVLRRNAKDLADWIDRANGFYKPYGAIKSGTPTEFRWPNGAIIRTGHLNDAKAFEQYQGHEYQRILIEEFTQIKRELDWRLLMGSCRSTIPGLRSEFIATTNPGGPGHRWVKKLFVDPAPFGMPFLDPETKQYRIFIRLKGKANKFLDQSYWNQFNALPEHMKKAWLDGDWNIMAGQYFEEWNPGVHVIKAFPIPAHWDRLVAIDWGYANDPYAVIFAAVDEMGRIYVYHEMTGHRMLPEDLAKKIIAFCPEAATVVGDPSMWGEKDGDSTAKKMQDAGLYQLSKAHNTRIQGWMRIAEYLKKEQIFVFSECRELIRCLPDLIHDEANPEDVMGDSEIDHLPDALRYLLMQRILASEAIDVEPEYVNERARLAHEHRKRMKSRARSSPD